MILNNNCATIPMMELRRLRLLLELSRRGTVTGVAESLAYSPSSVSVQLRELEHEVGLPLLRHVGRGVELTEAGVRLAAYAERALAAEEAALADVAALGVDLRGSVRLSFVQTPAVVLLPMLLASLAASAPHVQVEVRHLETLPALDELRSRTVDVTVGIEYDQVVVPRDRALERRDLLLEDVPLVMRADDDRAAGADVDLPGLRDAVWAAGHPGTGHAALVETVCNRHGGFAPDIRHRTDDALILGALVASGRAVTFLPALIASSVPGVVARSVRGATMRRTIFVATRASARASPAVAAVTDGLRWAASQAAAGREDVRFVE
jgi:DNA-binding transcriptional LysR family regulator